MVLTYTVVDHLYNCRNNFTEVVGGNISRHTNSDTGSTVY